VQQGGVALPCAEVCLTTHKNKPRTPETLSDQQIVLVALELVRRHGAEKLSMRQLAKEFEVTPMAIYHYFGNKESLFERLGDAVLARVPRPAPSGVRWREELITCAVCGWQLLSEYPGLSGYIIQRPPTQQLEELTRYGVSVLVAAGFDVESAYPAIVTCNAFMFGMIGMQAHTERGRGKGNKSGPGSTLTHADVRNLVEWGLDAFMSGLSVKLVQSKRALAERPRRTRRAASIKA
jgi:AcrR family transcriptional regulator